MHPGTEKLLHKQIACDSSLDSESEFGLLRFTL